MRSSLVLLFVAGLLATVAVAACSSAEADNAASTDDASTADASPENDAGDAADATPPRPTPPPLPIIPNQGGPIIASPEVVTVTWGGDPLAADLEAFDDWWAASATWKTMMAEWGVGPGKHVASVRLTGAAPAVLDGADVASLLLGGFTSGTIPAPNGSRVYMIYPPAETTVTSFGVAGCVGFQAYHYAVDVPASEAGPAVKAKYSVTPRCASTQGMSAIDYVTWGASHELMEAASDPVSEKPAWRIDEQSLATPEPGENADLCAGHPVQIEGHMITRNWSNVAAKAGERPCVPAPPGPMFGLFADPGEITVKPGTTVTVTVHAYAASTYPSFNVGAVVFDPSLTAKLSKKSAADGDELTLTVTASAGYVEQPVQNLVFLYAQSKDYTTKRHLIVHAKP